VKLIRTIIVSTAFLVPALACAGGDSSDGHTHGGAVPPEVIADVAPRTSTQSDEFELVAVLAAGKLTLYLDRYADNAPVPDVEVEVESGAFKAVAAQIAPGVYAVPGQAFANPGKHPLTISVQAGDTADLLSATLDLAAPQTGVEHAHGWGEWAVWSASGVLLLAGVGLVAVRRRRMNRKHKH
jgi:cobalt-zinc-cadmium efflux system membrane fusion protein